MKAQTITILGLGRTGASIGLALKASRLDVEIIGHDRDREAVRAARERGAIDDSSWRLGKAVSRADILIMAIPASEVAGTLQAMSSSVREHTLILDLSSLKGQGQQWAERHLTLGHYVGARAILAAEALADGTSGVAGARADLFRDSVFCLTPAPDADPKAVETAVNLGTLLGAKPFFLDPSEYDNLMLAVETLPGLMAAALFQAVTGAAGWRDMLRFANLPFAQATMPLRDDADLALLALQDQPAMLRWLDAVLEELQEVRRWVAEGDKERLAAFIEQLNLEREKWLDERTQNEWEEVSKSDFKPLSLTEHFLGRRGDASGL
ncbi:MAG TPA: prephenate dehydrogenase/arogenate dehydrogenase family protein [Candidatus Sulfomarinibacteraceae bacterium]|nr:prephenate dehydrogenase/arogenate dehydrogenase family protein [Candidatus Sulfomarinibacteraceae bacterium]